MSEGLLGLQGVAQSEGVVQNVRRHAENKEREDVYAAVLAALAGATSRRLHKLLTLRTPSEAYQAVALGDLSSEVAPAEVLNEWREAAQRFDLNDIAVRLDAANVKVTTCRDADHPPQLTHDIDPAPILFRRGTMPDPQLPHVGIVGTRRASSIGREVARELGMGLADKGVVVVSGLALGIDGEAHRGALAADGVPPLAVVGSGVDVVYPQRNKSLWHQIIERGALVAEAPLGAKPEPWRFPARNRLIAAFVDLLLVVESRAAGGSLLTVEQAQRRDIEVMAVPGSVRNPAAEGTNALLMDGCSPIRDVNDVLVALGLSEIAANARRDITEPVASIVSAQSRSSLAVRELSEEAARVLEAIDDGPTSTDQVVARSGLAVVRVAALIEELIVAELVQTDGARVRRKC